MCVLEETTGTTVDDLDEDGAERPRLPRAVLDRRSRPGPEPTTLKAVGNQWRYALVVVQAGDDDDYHAPVATICCGGQGQSGQAIKLFQITSYFNDFQTFDNPGS